MEIEQEGGGNKASEREGENSTGRAKIEQVKRKRTYREGNSAGIVKKS